MEVHNTCLLLKIVFKLLSGADNPWTVWIRRWYFGRDAPPPTPSWREFQALVPLVRSITTVKVGDGTCTSFWRDNWTSLGALASVLPAAFSHCLSTDVTVAAVGRGGESSLDLRERLSPAASTEMMLVTDILARLSLDAAPDQRRSVTSTAVGFRARDAYRLLRSSGCGPPLHDLNWANFSPVKVKVFVWILRHRRTRTRARLCRLGILRSPDCPFCPSVAEDIQHLFVACPRMQEVWACAAPGAGALQLDDMVGAFSATHPAWALPLRMTAATLLLWVAWKTRNRRVFDGLDTTTLEFFEIVQQHLRLWLVRAPRRLDCGPLVAWCASLPP